MTFSIVARDTDTGAFGVATATGGPVVGSLVPHARAGVGAIATQSLTNPLYGSIGLDLLGGGVPAQEVLDQLTAADAGRESRQCVIIGATGPAVAWTGSKAEAASGALVADGVGVAGNMLVSTHVFEAMLEAYQASGTQPFEDRLLAALRAGAAEGGDYRGIRSAALKVYTSEPYPAVDLRADWSNEPVAQLAEILNATRSQGYADFFRQLPKSGAGDDA